MTKAVLKNGVICPVEPLPADWTDGTELRIERVPAPKKRRRTVDIDAWSKEMEAIAAEMDPADDERLTKAIAEHRAQAKELAKRQLGLR